MVCSNYRLIITGYSGEFILEEVKFAMFSDLCCPYHVSIHLFIFERIPLRYFWEAMDEPSILIYNIIRQILFSHIAR